METRLFSWDDFLHWNGRAEPWCADPLPSTGELWASGKGEPGRQGVGSEPCFAFADLVSLGQDAGLQSVGRKGARS